MKQRIPFVGPSHESRSINADCQQTRNCYLEMDNASPRAPVALYGRPGLEPLGNIGSGPVRAMFREGGAVFVISGNEVYRLIYSGGYIGTFMGNIPSSTGPVGIASNGPQILIVDGLGGYMIDTVAITLANVTDPGFPVGVKRAAYQDGYFIVTGDGSQKFYLNETPYDGLAWNGLDFASAEGSPDNTVGCISDHRELWLFGDTSVEVWVNTGNPDFPFERSGNTFIEHGCAAADTIAKLDNTIFWLGTDDRGGAIVWKANGYTPVRASDHAVEKAMQSYIIGDARAWTYQQEGHSFYVITFPTADKTWVYDVSTGQWFEWSTLETFFGTEKAWRAACHVFFGGDHLVGDLITGRFYKLNLDYYLDDAAAITRRRVTQAMEENQQRLFYSSLQIDMETGVTGTLALRFSDDGGHTWSGYKSASIGSTYGSRCIFRRLGSGRNRVWEISSISNSKFAVIGAIADVERGD